MKKYEIPMLQIVSINNKDIVTASFTMNYSTSISDENSVGAAGRRFDDYEVY